MTELPTTSGDVRREFRRALLPDLAASLDRVFTAGASEGAGQDRGIPEWVDRIAAELRDTRFAGAAFSDIPDPTVRARFQQDFAAAESVTEWAGIVLPTPEAFAENGTDFMQLAELAATDATLRLVPAPVGLGLEGWRMVYRHAASEPGSPLREGGLRVATEVERAFDALDRSDARTLVAGRGTPEPEAGARERRQGSARVAWSLALVPAGAMPPVVGLAHANSAQASLAELLMLQAMHLAEEREPIDTHAFTWIAATFAEGKLAARHTFDGTAGVVALSSREIGQQGPHQGARAPLRR